MITKDRVWDTKKFQYSSYKRRPYTEGNKIAALTFLGHYYINDIIF